MRKLLPVLLILFFASCAEDKKGSVSFSSYLPQDSAVILQMKNPDLFFSNLQNNEFVKINREHPVFKELEGKISVLNYFPHKNEALFALTAAKEENSIDFTFISRGRISPPSIDSLRNVQVETFTSTDYEITKYILEGKTVFSSSVDSISILSSSRERLEESIKAGYIPSPDLSTALRAASDKLPSIFFNHIKMPPFLSEIFPEEFRKLSHWTVVDVEISQAAIILNGISVARDSIPGEINSIEGVGLAPNTLASLTPVEGKEFTSLSFRDSKKLLGKLNSSSLNSDIFSTELKLLETSIEAGVIQLTSNSVFVIQTLDPDAAKLNLDFELKQTEDFRGNAVYSYPNPKAFKEIFKPVLNINELYFFTFFDTYILFAETPAELKEVITAVQNEMVLANTEAYKTSSEKLSSEASILIVRNNQVPDDGPGGFDYGEFPISAVQFIYQNNFAHVHAVMQKSAALKTDKATAQAATVDLGAALAGRPVFFKNHRSKGMDIAVQDVENTLYLISPEGRIYWKKKLESLILGEVYTVDILRNGRHQLAFVTQDKLHVIDRDGNVVKPFPLNFRDPITQPLSVFDYDNKRDYRFVITQGRDLLMYDRKGKAVRGFDFSKAASEITNPPKHIRLGRKDYILVPESSGKLHILSRTGNTRVAVKENLEFSDNEWYEYNENFVSTNASGQILKINDNGNVKKEDLNLAGNTRITATAKTLVTLSENELSIGKNSVTLDFGLYTEPQIFYINNKIYVSVTDLQAHKVYLFDSNANLLPGFPVYGNSLIDLSNADDDDALELVVQGEEKGLLVYEVR